MNDSNKERIVMAQVIYEGFNHYRPNLEAACADLRHAQVSFDTVRAWGLLHSSDAAEYYRHTRERVNLAREIVRDLMANKEACA